MQRLGAKVVVIQPKSSGLAGILGVSREAFKNRHAGRIIFSGFKAGMAALLLKVVTFGSFHYQYDYVEWKLLLCQDNWKGSRRLLLPAVDWFDRQAIGFADIVYSADNNYPAAHSIQRVRKDYVAAENGYDPEIFSPGKYDRAALRAKWGVDSPLLLFTGKLTRMYGKYIETVIDALPELGTVRFWIFGDGPELERLKSKAIARGLPVDFKGYVDHCLTPELITVADVGVNAYRTVSLKCREWDAMGLPYIMPKGCEWSVEDVVQQVRECMVRDRAPRPIKTWEESARVILEQGSK
jgi:glycosyltransferase involved in cell wall biosynthesis